MNIIKIIALLVVLVFGSIAAVDHWYVPQLTMQYEQIEKERLETANKLTTARIIHENLNHVRDLIFKNMVVPGMPDTIQVETEVFRFLTESVQDLKLTLVAVKPIALLPNGRISTYPYEIELEGDFFKFGELCTKIENNRRIMAVTQFEVSLMQPSDDLDVRLKNQNQPVRIKMRLETFKVK